MKFKVNPLILEVLQQKDPCHWMQDRNSALSVVAGMQGKKVSETNPKQSNITLQQALQSNPALNIVEFFQHHAPDAEEWEFLYHCASYRMTPRVRMRTYLDVIESYPESFVPPFIFSEEAILPKLSDAALTRLRLELFRWDSAKMLGLYQRVPKLRPLLLQTEDARFLEAISYIDTGVSFSGSFSGKSVAELLLRVNEVAFLAYIQHPSFGTNHTSTPIIDAAITLAMEGKISVKKVIAWILHNPAHELPNLVAFLANDAVAKALVPTLLNNNIEVVVRAKRLPKKLNLTKLDFTYSTPSSDVLHALSHYPDFPKFLTKHLSRDWDVDERSLYNVNISIKCIMHFNEYPSSDYVLWASRNYPALFSEMCKEQKFSQECTDTFLRAGEAFDIRIATDLTQNQITKWLTTVPEKHRDAYLLQLQFEGFSVSVPPHLKAHSAALSTAKI